MVLARRSLPIFTTIGTIGATAPIRPWMPVLRSCSKAPTILPVFEILNELLALDSTVTTSAVAIGTRTGPRPRNGWPKASTWSP